MAKVITFSRTFPAYHPKKGQPTYFVEKLWNSIGIDRVENISLPIERYNYCFKEIEEPKHHTIRAGNRFKVGDYFSPRVWSGKPYNSKQIIIAPDIEIKKVWEIESTGNNALYINNKSINVLDVEILAKNDGLSYNDLLEWLKYPDLFKGQIICWNENIEY